MAIMIAGAMAVAGSVMSSRAGKSAANKNKRAAEGQKAENAAAYNEQKNTMAPWMEAGRTAIGDIQSGIKNGSFDPGEFHFDAKSLKEDPGYRFRVSEANRMADQRVGASGKYFSTQGQKQLAANSQGIADQEFGNAYARARDKWSMEGNRLNQKYNALRDMSAGGQNAASNAAQFRGNMAQGNAQQTGNIINANNAYAAAQAEPWQALESAGGMGLGYGAQNALNNPSTTPATPPPANAYYAPEVGGATPNYFGRP